MRAVKRKVEEQKIKEEREKRAAEDQKKEEELFGLTSERRREIEARRLAEQMKVKKRLQEQSNAKEVEETATVLPVQAEKTPGEKRPSAKPVTVESVAALSAQEEATEPSSFFSLPVYAVLQAVITALALIGAYFLLATAKLVFQGVSDDGAPVSGILLGVVSFLAVIVMQFIPFASFAKRIKLNYLFFVVPVLVGVLIQILFLVVA